MSVRIDPALPGWSRPPATPVQLRRDLIGGAAIFCCMMPSMVLYDLSGLVGSGNPPWLTPLWCALLAATVAMRRRMPMTVALLALAVYIVGIELQATELLFSQIALFITIYTAGAWAADRRRVRIVLGVIGVALGVWFTVSAFRSALDPEIRGADAPFSTQTGVLAYLGIQLIINLMYFGGAVYFGFHAFASARQRAELEYRTAELEDERERSTEQAIALDRLRIARELHDVVAHHVSVMGVQAGAARTVLDADRDQAARALRLVEENARTAIDELHGLVGTLRQGESDDPAALGPSTIGLDRLGSLVAESEAAGVPCAFTELGERQPLSPTVSATLYRIAQEALTNVRKYAGAHARADVRVRHRAGSVELEVTNTGHVPATPRPGGVGHLGMRERIAAVGGQIEIGPRPDGYLVRAVAPTASASADLTGASS